ncbi:protein NO VEIN domain-containing protein [Micromonospora purpureochromogenes]|uniref:protein NO VEIN domain-containing protein n=1 Tax=Micromonospora purpureochromogenes TaxID=47872 RepID=UPI00362B01C4
MEIVGNRAIETAAIDYVIMREGEAGRTAYDVRGTGAAGDVASPPLMIEVKAYGKSARGTDLWLEVRQVEEARQNPDFWIYVVENVRQGDPSQFTLKMLGGERLQKLLGRAKEQRYYTLPWPVADYDTPA